GSVALAIGLGALFLLGVLFLLERWFTPFGTALLATAFILVIMYTLNYLAEALLEQWRGNPWQRLPTHYRVILGVLLLAGGMAVSLAIVVGVTSLLDHPQYVSGWVGELLLFVAAFSWAFAGVSLGLGLIGLLVAVRGKGTMKTSCAALAVALILGLHWL